MGVLCFTALSYFHTFMVTACSNNQFSYSLKGKDPKLSVPANLKPRNISTVANFIVPPIE